MELGCNEFFFFQARPASVCFTQKESKDGSVSIYGPRGAGFANVSLSCALHLDKRILPDFALSTTYKSFLQARAKKRLKLER